MISKKEQAEAREAAARLIEMAGFLLTSEEQQAIEVVDFGLSNLKKEGAQISTIVQTERIGVKLVALTPFQVLPEHWHPPVGDDPGKEETLRHLYGDLSVFLPGQSESSLHAIPEGKSEHYSCRKEARMKTGETMTLAPGTKHWFAAGKRGAVAFSFSTVARDVLDQFTDPNIVRITQVEDGGKR